MRDKDVIWRKRDKDKRGIGTNEGSERNMTKEGIRTNEG